MRRRRKGRREAGYNLVALVILVTVMNVLIAAALPLLSQQMRRDKEEELIFRGLQYAEAIRVFQLRFGRYPTRLEELIETEPRSIRQLWTDPMREDVGEEGEGGEEGEEMGAWGLVMAQQGAAGRQPTDPDGRDRSGGDRSGGEGSSGPETGSQPPGRRQTGVAPRRPGEGTVTVGPILGVHSLSSEASIKTFAGANRYRDWLFTVDLLPQAPGVFGEAGIPSLNSRWVGRGFPEDAELPGSGDVPKDLIPADKEPSEEGDRSDRRRRRRRDG